MNAHYSQSFIHIFDPDFDAVIDVLMHYNTDFTALNKNLCVAGIQNASSTMTFQMNPSLHESLP